VYNGPKKPVKETKMTPWEKKTYTSRRPADFSIREVFRKMQKINFLINSRFQRPFPKPRERLLSFLQIPVLLGNNSGSFSPYQPGS